MNIWGWLFVLPMILLMVFDPWNMIPAMIFCVLFIAAGIWIVNAIIGKKDIN